MKCSSLISKTEYDDIVHVLEARTSFWAPLLGAHSPRAERSPTKLGAGFCLSKVGSETLEPKIDLLVQQGRQSDTGNITRW